MNKTNLLNILKENLNHHFSNEIKYLILFGSQAAGTAHKDSDYDVLIVLDYDYDLEFKKKLRDIVYDMELEYDVLIDTFLISTKELKYSLRGAQPVFMNAVKNGIYI